MIVEHLRDCDCVPPTCLVYIRHSRRYIRVYSMLARRPKRLPCTNANHKRHKPWQPKQSPFCVVRQIAELYVVQTVYSLGLAEHHAHRGRTWSPVIIFVLPGCRVQERACPLRRSCARFRSRGFNSMLFVGLISFG